MKKLILFLALIIPLKAQYSPAAVQARFYGQPVGTSTVTYYYWVQGVTSTGRTILAGPGAVTFRGTGLTNQSFDFISWQGSPDILGYDILRTTTSTIPTGACNCAIATNYALTYITDMGLALQTYTVQAASGGGGGSVTVPVGNVVIGITGNVAGDSGVAFSNIPLITQANTFSAAITSTGFIGPLTGIASGNEFPLSFSSPLSRTSNTISMPQATNSASGYLASADWISFNGKQAALGFTPLNSASNLSDLNNAATARTNLGLGTAATQTIAYFQAALGYTPLNSVSPAFTGGISGTGGATVDALTVTGGAYIQGNQNPTGMPSFAANTFTLNWPASITTSFGWTYWPSADCTGTTSSLGYLLTVVSDVGTCDTISGTGSLVGSNGASIANATLNAPTITGVPTTNRTAYNAIIANSLLYPVGLQVEQAPLGVQSCSPLVATTAQATVGGVVSVGNLPMFIYQVISDVSTTVGHLAGCSVTGTSGYATDLGTAAFGSVPNTTKVIGIWTSTTTASGGATSGATLELFADGVFGTQEGNAPTATALAAAPTNCSTGFAPQGINASGTAQNCTQYAHATVIIGNLSSGTIALSSTQFLGFLGSIPVAASQPATISTRQAMIPFAGTARNLGIQITGAQPASGSLVCTLQLTHSGSTAATSLVVTIAASAAAGTYFDTTDTATNAIFDSYALSCVNNATAVSATIGNVALVLQ